MIDSHTLEQKRQAALQRLRERRKEPRRDETVDIQDRAELRRLAKPVNETESRIDVVRRYLDIRSNRPKSSSSSIQQTPAIAENPFVGLADISPDNGLSNAEISDKRTPGQILLERLGGQDFLKHMHVWLYGADVTFHPSSSSIEEIEQYRKEVRYRHSLLTAMLQATQKELDGLEAHLRAVKAFQENQESSQDS